MAPSRTLLLCMLMVVSGCGGTPEGDQALPSGPLLVTFLGDLRQRQAANANRAQIVVAKSMSTQFLPRGVASVIVLSGDSAGKAPDRTLAVEAKLDWALDDLLVLPDGNGELARRYEVHDLPSTILLDETGRVIRRWVGFAPAQDLALPLEDAYPRPRRAFGRQSSAPASR